MTRREVRDALERSGIQEDERQPEIVRLAFQFGIVDNAEKGNHPGET